MVRHGKASRLPRASPAPRASRALAARAQAAGRLQGLRLAALPPGGRAEDCPEAPAAIEPRAMKATVYVRLKQEVLDPQGDAVKRALDALGFSGVKGVRVGKLIEIELDPSAGGKAELEQRLAEMADEMLANAVIEDYEIAVSP
jgi:phosphoribosylformylglycinamidine synthase